MVFFLCSPIKNDFFRIGKHKKNLIIGKWNGGGMVPIAVIRFTAIAQPLLKIFPAKSFKYGCGFFQNLGNRKHVVIPHRLVFMGFFNCGGF